MKSSILTFRECKIMKRLQKIIEAMLMRSLLRQPLRSYLLPSRSGESSEAGLFWVGRTLPWYMQPLARIMLAPNKRSIAYSPNSRQWWLAMAKNLYSPR